MKQWTISLGLLVLGITGCIETQPYGWHDTRTPARAEFTPDFEFCRDYAARQYSPGIPKGVAYRDGDGGYPHGHDPAVTESGRGGSDQSVWRPGTDPYKDIHVTEEPTFKHDVPYTGYPGRLDYSPDYLDDILLDCMSDRGWDYRELPKTTRDGGDKEKKN